MPSSRRMKGSRAGFTLPEVLVAVAMVGVLSAVVLPNVVGQMSKGEVSRVVQDMQSVAQGAQMFRADVGTWPADLTALVDTVGISSANSLDGTAYGTGLNQWNGPYLGRGDVTGGLKTSLDGTITVAALGAIGWDGTPGDAPEFVVIKVDGIAAEDAVKIDQAVDGGASPDTVLTEDTAGNIRYSNGVLYYFVTPLK